VQCGGGQGSPSAEEVLLLLELVRETKRASKATRLGSGVAVSVSVSAVSHYLPVYTTDEWTDTERNLDIE